ncbi:DUF7518 family protein [Halopiger xanaduensis]|uniref:Chromosome segregation protein SMC n=1 Tax=Halopiger xanaduensis (strain DSM 18323 / JCM 14033 / SH-6) TaxID=797210 RepID=F8DD18_HALXS|nr:hypothetical protein [Halopiger xanaduensis]AEH38491.1 hypothetical protein Halxa_3886 [Halopiger xanaduensis SH-6]
MSNNRVEQLESTVAELESTVEGLTDELIEAKERIRVLEAELDAETPTRVPERRSDKAETDDTATTTEAAPDEVAEATADAANVDAETDADEAPSGDEAEDSGTDDIIIA